MEIQLAESDANILRCYPVMRELRPDFDEKTFLNRVRLQGNSGYLLSYVKDSEKIVAVAGFWIGEGLSWKRFLYVADLVTLSGHRSKGYGSKLLKWLENYAAKNNCQQMHLDSGIKRKDAHRFYENEGMEMVAFHYCKKIVERKPGL